MKHFSLVLFTLGSQAAAGAYLVLSGISLLGGGQAESALLTIPRLGILLVLLGLSTAASLLHLGASRRAWRALLNAGSSWLSCEIAGVLAFGALLAGHWLYAVLAGAEQVPGVYTVLVSLAALLLLYAMSRAYMLRTAPAWNTPFTLLGFAAAALLLGSLLSLALLGGQGAPAGQPAHWLVKLVVGMMAVDGLLSLSRSRSSSSEYGALKERRQPPQTLVRLHLVLLVLAAFLLVLPTLQPAPLQVWAALGLASGGMLARRVRFYEMG
jgi:DMSO reductase anchor subunit